MDTTRAARTASTRSSTPSRWVWAQPPVVGDILGVDTDAVIGGGVVHITGQGLTAYNDSDPAAGSDTLVEALIAGLQDHNTYVNNNNENHNNTVALLLFIERRWQDKFVLVSLPQSVCPDNNNNNNTLTTPGTTSCLMRLRVTNAHGCVLTPYINAPELHWVQPFARPGAEAAVYGRRFWGGQNDYCVVLAAAGQRDGRGGDAWDGATVKRHGSMHTENTVNDGHRTQTGSSAAPTCIPAIVHNENKLTFTVPSSTPLGATVVALRDSHGRTWGRDTVASGLSVADRMTVVAPAPSLGPRIDASQPPYALDPSGRSDVTTRLFAAVVAASANGTRPGGQVVLAAGTFLVNSTAGCHASSSTGGPNSIFTAICELPKQFAVTLVGAGMGKTVIHVGSGLGSFVQATPVSMQDLTITDKLQGNPQHTPAHNQSAAYGSSMVGLDWASAGTGTGAASIAPPQVSPSMLGSGLDWSTSVLMNNTDMRLERVHLVSTRAAATVSFGNTQRLVIKDSIIDGGCVWLNGPVRDVRFTGNLVRNGGLGNGWGGSGMAIRLGSGHFAGLVFENNTFDHLVANLSESGFSGRMFVAQHMMAERVYFANNTNLRAGPGDLSQQNSGEQVLWETQDNVPLRRGAVASSTGASVTLVDSNVLNVNSSDGGWSPLFAYYTRIGGANAARHGAGNAWGYSHANAEFHGYCHVDEATGVCATNVTIGLVHVVQGTGTGQTRRILGISADNKTLYVDRPFAVPPDATSTLSLCGGSMVDLIARDLIIRGGMPARVTSADHTATTAIVVWDSGHRLMYSDIHVEQYRQTILVNGWRNSTLSDVVIQRVRGNDTRSGISVATQGQASDGAGMVQWDANQPNIGISIRNVTLSTVPFSDWDTQKPQEGHGADATSDGGIVIGVGCGYDWNNARLATPTGSSMIVIEDVHMTNVSVAVNFLAPCGENPTAAITGAGRFAALLLRNVNADGGTVGMLVDDNVSTAAAGIAVYNVNTTGFQFPRNISWDLRYRRPWHGRGVGTAVLQPQLQLLTPFVPLPKTAANDGQEQWTVAFRNVGLSDGQFQLTHLDPRLMVSSTNWTVSAGQRQPTELNISRNPTGPTTPTNVACGAISDHVGGQAQFCVALS